MSIRGLLYIYCIVSLSVRIELVCFLITLTIFDFLSFRKEGRPFFDRMLLKSFLFGICIFSLLTMYPFYFMSKFTGIATDAMPLASQKTFEKAISIGISNGINSGAFFDSIFTNFSFYFLLALSSLGAIFVIALLFLNRRFRKFIKFAGDFKSLFFIYFHIFFFSSFIILFPYHATHYFLSISLLLLILNAYILLNSQRNRFTILLCCFNLIFLLSLSGSFTLNILFQKDTRLAAKEELLKLTNERDLLAIETISMNGYHPLVNECPETLREKSIAVQKTKKGTGLYHQLKSIEDSSGCRNILDVFSEDYYSATEGKGKWINDYDIIQFLQRDPKYYITAFDINASVNSKKVNLFHSTVLSKYILLNTFECTSFDPRLTYLISTEPYFKNIFIYKKNEFSAD